MRFSHCNGFYYLEIFTFLIAVGLLANPFQANAELYQYTDNQGIIHFTDDPQKVPKSIRKKSMREGAPSLSPQDKKMIDGLMKRGNIERDLQFSNSKELNDTTTILRESVRKELVDPEDLNKPLDPRLSTPENAINLYRKALRTGNMRDLKACVTNSYWETMSPEFAAMGKQKMAQIEHEIATIEKIEQDNTYAKFEVIRLEEGNKMSYPVSLENAFGNWKISTF